MLTNQIACQAMHIVPKSCHKLISTAMFLALIIGCDEPTTDKEECGNACSEDQRCIDGLCVTIRMEDPDTTPPDSEPDASPRFWDTMLPAMIEMDASPDVDQRLITDVFVPADVADLMDMCVPNDCRTTGCPEAFVCRRGECLPDACHGISCPPLEEGTHQLCRDGQCVPSCALIRCPVGEICTDGICGSDPCLDVVCEDEQSCYQGRCVDACNDCLSDQVCIGGRCQDHPCLETHCPPAQRCIINQLGYAQCEEDPYYGIEPDMSIPDAMIAPSDMGTPPQMAADAAMTIVDASTGIQSPPPSNERSDQGGCATLSLSLIHI